MPAVQSKMTFARFTPAARNRTIGIRLAGAERENIRNTILKSDGQKGNLRAIDQVLSNYEQDPDYDANNISSGGRPRSLTVEQEHAVLKVLMRDVGKFVVTARYVKKKLLGMRLIPDKTIQRTFDRLGYAYRDRRRKAIIDDVYKPARCTYAHWLLKQDQAFLNTFCYTDGTTFFLAADSAQYTDKTQAALGRKVWRLKDGSDALEDKNVGPSSYAKAQGQPVKIWGLLGNGHLEYFLLPEVIDHRGRKRSANMNGDRYEQMAKRSFKAWKKKLFPRAGSTKLPLV